MPCQRNATPLCYQGPHSCIPFGSDLKSHTRTLVGLKRGSEATINPRNAHAQFTRERSGQRLFHRPLQAIELMQVVGPAIVLHHASIFPLELGHDAEDRVVNEFRAVYRFAMAEISFALVPHDGWWDAQPDLPIQATVTASITLLVVVQDLDVIAEKARCL
jgi:hypothetical protein